MRNCREDSEPLPGLRAVWKEAGSRSFWPSPLRGKVETTHDAAAFSRVRAPAQGRRGRAASTPPPDRPAPPPRPAAARSRAACRARNPARSRSCAHQGKRMPSSFATCSASSIIAVSSASRPLSDVRRSMVAPVSTDSGLKQRLPHSLSQISVRMSRVMGASRRPAFMIPASALIRALSEPSASPMTKRLLVLCSTTPGATTSAHG
jgi:hypothetical protein